MPVRKKHDTIMLLATVVTALALVGPTPSGTTTHSTVVTRRSALASSALLVNGLVQAAGATAVSSINNQIPDDEVVEAQQARSSKIDLNNAMIVDYMSLQGMYPRVAGIIASHGPYKSVSDVYKLPQMTQADKDIMRKYERELTVLPPGRMFKERINQRQST